MFAITHRKYFYALSATLVAVSLVALFVWGIKLGVDFKGGTIMEVTYNPSSAVVPSQTEMLTAVTDTGVTGVSIRKTGGVDSRTYILRTDTLDESKKNEVVGALSFEGKNPLEVNRFSAIGPILGKEAARKSLISIVLVVVAILAFITFAFRKVSAPVASWKYGLFAVVALVHDILIPAGFFAVLGQFAGVEVDTLFVTAILVILGFSVHDTIVVFDRVREHLKNNELYREKKPFDVIVGESIRETVARSINTSLTTLFSLVALYFIGPEATKYFSLAMIVGIIAGTYSSIFLASSLLVTANYRSEKKTRR